LVPCLRLIPGPPPRPPPPRTHGLAGQTQGQDPGTGTGQVAGPGEWSKGNRSRVWRWMFIPVAAALGPRSASRSHSPSHSPTHPLPAGDRLPVYMAPPAAWRPGHPAPKTIKRKPGDWGSPTPPWSIYGA
jgi:hypothetical protein